ncbi:MAG: DUF1800 domain-containing protein [Actinomycetota bacterium]|nr:DUF1800 domain-containing protein [Actinomycetota bacterium]
MSTQSSAWLAAARIVRRTGFGATGSAVDAAVRGGIDSYLAATLRPVTDPGATATPMPVIAPLPPLGKAASREDKLKQNQQRRDQLQTLTYWWLRRMVAVQHPFTERITFGWHNHFATAATKVRSAPAMAHQNQTLRQLGAGDFRTLAQAMLVDPAMLYWLDGQKNTVKGANENLSREFMELFALGHGDGYTETDVREGARALTGWRIEANQTSAMLRPGLHDQQSKTVLGVSGNLDQAGFCDAVLARPASAAHVCGRWYGQLVSDTAPDAATLSRLVSAYGSGRNLGAMFHAIYADESFTQSANSIVVSPVEWLIGAARALKVPMTADSTKRLAGVLRSLGQLPFYPPNVSGWPSGHAWLSTAAADLRMQAATALTKAADLSFVSTAASSQRIDATGYLLGIGNFSDRTVKALQPLVADPARLVSVALNSPEYLVH